MENAYEYRQPGHLVPLEDMRLQGTFCDVTIQVEEAKFPAHKIILVSATRYFANMLLNNFQESNREIIVIKGVSVANMNELITFAYTGKITLTEQNVMSLIKDADYLDFLDLREGGIKFLKSCLNMENIHDARRLAEEIDCASLLEDCKIFMHQHFLDVSLSHDYLDFDIEFLNDILTSNESHVSSQLLFKAIMRWILNDIGERKKHLPKLLGFIDFSSVSIEFLTSYFFKDLSFYLHPSMWGKDSGLVADIISFCSFSQQNSCENKKGIITIDRGDLHQRACDGPYMEVYNTASGMWELITMEEYVAGTATVHKDKLYAIASDGIEVFEPQNKTWETKSPMNFCRHQSDAVSIHGFLYVCGGYYYDDPENPHSVSSSVTDILERYCAENDEWETMSPMNGKRYDHAAVTFQGFIYAIGGCNDAKDGCAETIYYLDTVERYDPRIDRWTVLDSKLQRAREACGAAVLKGKIYVAGGYSRRSLTDNFDVGRSVEVYDPDTNRWEYVASMNTARSSLQLVAYLGKLWAIGGNGKASSEGIGASLSTVEVYDPDSNSWSYAPSMSKMKGCVSCAVVSKWW